MSGADKRTTGVGAVDHDAEWALAAKMSHIGDELALKEELRAPASGETRYAKSGDLSIAYQVDGRGTGPRMRRGIALARGAGLGDAGDSADLPAAGAVRAADHLRQARHGSLRPKRRAADAGRADGRCAGGDGRGRQRVGCTCGHVGGRADVAAVRRHLSRAGHRARAVVDLRAPGLGARLPIWRRTSSSGTCSATRWKPAGVPVACGR